MISGDEIDSFRCLELIDRIYEVFEIPVHSVIEISRDDDEIRLDVIDLGDSFFEKIRSNDVSEMHIRDLDDRFSFPIFGEILEMDIDIRDDRMCGIIETISRDDE